MNLVIVLFTFEETFSPLSLSFYLKVPLPFLGSAGPGGGGGGGGARPPPPPACLQLSFRPFSLSLLFAAQPIFLAMTESLAQAIGYAVMD